MKLETLIIKNFRGYKEETRISFEGMTAFVGKNDIGKSSILEALEIFFNNDAVKIESADACVYNDDKEVIIGCIFGDLPEQVVIDSRATTSLMDEYFLNAEEKLQLIKKFNCALKTPKEMVFAVANHPTSNMVNDLLLLKNQELKDRLNHLGVSKDDVDLRSNVSIRRAIWDNVPDLNPAESEIPLEKEDAKKIWDKLRDEMPVFALFKSDRASKDDDSEVQDPMKVAVAEAIKSVEDDLARIKDIIRAKSTEVAQKTLEKLREMDPNLANELSPVFKAEPKWDGIFKLTLTSDDQIPINKRGSGVRRLILLNFFRAEVERRQHARNSPGVIYAIEEPETSQHPNTQKILIEALMSLSEQDACQVILTTHVPGLASFLPLESLRAVEKDSTGKVCIISHDDDIYDRIAKELGVFADHRIQVFVCVEGPNDVCFLKHISKLINDQNGIMPDLSNDPRVAILPLGGGTLNQWVQNHYLKEIKRPEIHVYDRDLDNPPKYKGACDKVNCRGDNSWATLTGKREMENYLHPDAIKNALGIDVAFSDNDDVPEIVARAVHDGSESLKKWDDLLEDNQKEKMGKAKKRLNDEVASRMTYQLLSVSDPNKDIEGWLIQIANRLS
jgi:putative ATP-dependent endonuclease of the OLD family